MTDLFEQYGQRIANSLQRQVRDFLPVGIGRWKFVLPVDGRWLGCVSSDNEWLVLRTRPEAPLAARVRTTESLLQMLRANAWLPGGVKFAVESHLRQFVLVGEIPLDEEEVDLDQRIQEVMEGFRQAALGWPELQLSPPTMASAKAMPSEDSSWGAAMSLCQQSGLTASVRGDGRLFVKLDVPGEFCQAMLSCSETQSARLTVELSNVELNTAARHATEAVLLEGCRIVRMARATARKTNEGLSYGWETVLPETASVRALQLSIATLSLACRLTVREARALQDEGVAAEYLYVRGWPVSRSTVCSI